MKWWHPGWVLLTAWGAEPTRRRGQRRLPDDEAAKHQRQLAYAHMWMLSGAGIAVSLALIVLFPDLPTIGLLLMDLPSGVWPCTFAALMLLGLGRRPPSDMRRRATAASIAGVVGGLLVGLAGLSLE